ncbi:hypothetical protein FZC76_06920 [Sutcliffiella horikoshii]|uniref:Uncharacterized protein n=1 Tax=Sutcliffiella horikoshii TaxID=79883 RepID=A0A5D4T2K3_9BACI|nr:hypothetical protein [Sutcliffiella horikoshii]TYS68672.1 hypothetical protein FZC76_06920 [Sutcliffiella horikoshii]
MFNKHLTQTVQQEAIVIKQYDKGYLDGQLDSAENELEILLRIKEDSNEIWHKNSILITRIRDTEDFLKKHGRY